MYNAILSRSLTRRRYRRFCPSGGNRNTAEEETTMSLFTLRERALAGSIVAGLMGAWTGLAVPQQKPTPPLFSWDLTGGGIGPRHFPPVPGRVPPLPRDPKHPLRPHR